MSLGNYDSIFLRGFGILISGLAGTYGRVCVGQVTCGNGSRLIRELKYNSWTV
jgi:hypothetical protein